LTPRILALWSAPRSRSTAFYQMMAERGDFQLVHEPFSYLAEFGESTVDGRVARCEPELLAALRGLAERGPVFFKDTTDERYPGVLADKAFLAADATHTFIIRHPRDTIASYHAINPQVSLHQIGFETQHEIYQAVREATGTQPVVIDADDLVVRPEEVVRAYCAEVDIPYLPEALGWPPGSRPEWTPTERWHADVSASSGFTRPRKDYGLDVAAHPVLGEYLRHHLPFYEAMHNRS
jgi:hypothetical protein